MIRKVYKVLLRRRNTDKFASRGSHRLLSIMNFLISLLFLLLSVTSTLCMFHNTLLTVNNTNINCYRSYNIVPRRRPASERVLSLEEYRYSYGNAPLARHHIIPYATLRDFYNRLLSDEANFRRLYEQVLMVSASNAGLHIRRYPEDNRNYFLTSPLQDLPTTLRNHLTGVYQVGLTQEVYIWLPFNIFLGPRPNLRTDDAQSNSLEDNAYVIIGQQRLDQLREMYNEMTQYTSGANSDPTHIIDTMIDLVRITPEPYPFRINQWRVHISRHRYAIATPEIIADSSYRELQPSDYCNESGEHAFDRYNPPEFDRVPRSSRQRRDIHLGCLLRDEEGGKYDRFCINSLNILQDLVKHNVLAVNGDELDIVHSTPPSQCNTELAVVSGAVVGGLTVLGACLLAGGAYVPVLGWVGCAIGSSLYGIAGATVGAGASVICNEL